MRKLLIAVSFTSAFALIADDASARPRGARMSSPAPKPALATTQRRAAVARPAKAQEDAALPRHWKLALPPRTSRPKERTEGEQPTAQPGDESGVPVAAASAPGEAASRAAPRTEPQPAAKPAGRPPVQSAAKKPDRPAAIRLAGVKPDAARKQAVDGPKLPHKFAVCYWNQAGQCVAR